LGWQELPGYQQFVDHMIGVVTARRPVLSVVPPENNFAQPVFSHHCILNNAQ
jgi:hypothetical protein